MRGRKPDSAAIRRGLKPGTVSDGERRGVRMPDDIARNPVLSKIWEWICPAVNTFDDQDVPILRELVTWHAVFEQGASQIVNDDGSVELSVEIGETGKGQKNPVLSQMKMASSEIRALSDMLGLSPLARSRIGLINATTVKTAADTAAMFSAIDDAYGNLAEAEIVEIEPADAED